MSDEKTDPTDPTDEVDPEEGDIVEERMDRIYPNRHMTAEDRPEIPESGIEESPETSEPDE